MIFSQGATVDNLEIKGKRIHFIGVGGISMSSIAIMAHKEGAIVSGCDVCESEATKTCVQAGVKVCVGHSPEHVKNTDIVVYSSAIPLHNLEMITARESNITIVPRALMLARLLRSRTSIGIAGSHGKTTTTYIVSQLFSDQDYDPAVMVGGRVNEWHASFHIGKGKYFISEVDESDGSLLMLNQNNSIITNIDLEHLDYYRDINHVKAVFREYAENTDGGYIVACGDDQNIRSALEGINRDVVFYGLKGSNDACPKNVVMNGIKRTFTLEVRGKSIGEFDCPLLGEHNLSNCVGALTLCSLLGLDPKGMAKSTAKLRGVIRRQDALGEVGGIRVVDDYAHHPTEIRETIKALRELKAERLVIVFQPHRYTRTAALAKELATALTAADYVVLAEIYSANETPITGVTSYLVARHLNDLGFTNYQYISKNELILKHLKTMCKPGDLLVTMGAGDIRKLGERFVDRSGE